MEASFWHDRWDNANTPWHREQTNPGLERHWATLGVPPSATAFVPLCGASEDMAWLARRGHRVLGVDLSELAAKRFYADHGYAATRTELPPFVRYHSDVPQQRVAILAGDAFALTPEHLAGVDAVYDRAALVALPPDMRTAYADHLLATLPPGTPILLLTYEYDLREMDGPPFCVPQAQVRELFSNAAHVEALESREILDDESRMRNRGLTALTQHAFVIET